MYDVGQREKRAPRPKKTLAGKWLSSFTTYFYVCL